MDTNNPNNLCQEEEQKRKRDTNSNTNGKRFRMLRRLLSVGQSGRPTRPPHLSLSPSHAIVAASLPQKLDSLIPPLSIFLSNTYAKYCSGCLGVLIETSRHTILARGKFLINNKKISNLDLIKGSVLLLGDTNIRVSVAHFEGERERLADVALILFTAAASLPPCLLSAKERESGSSGRGGGRASGRIPPPPSFPHPLFPPFLLSFFSMAVAFTLRNNVTVKRRADRMRKEGEDIMG